MGYRCVDANHYIKVGDDSSGIGKILK